MMEAPSVTVRLFARLREAAGTSEIALQAQDIRGLLDALVAKAPSVGSELLEADGRLRQAVTVMVNGRNIEFLGGLDTPLRGGDTVAVFPVVAGG